MTNESGLSTNGSKDISISNVPAVGKRDLIVVDRSLPDGTRERSEYRNAYLWEASDDWQEKVEQWLCVRSDYSYQSLLTLVVFRLWSASAQLALVSVPALGYIIGAALVVALVALLSIVVKTPALLAPASLRLFLVVVGTFA